MRIELIRPSQSFRDAEEVVALAGLPEDLALLYSIDLPVLPVLLDDNGLPLDLPNQFIASLALLRSSATGKTASTYAECFHAWLHRKKLLLTPLGDFVCTRNSLRLPYCGERSQTHRSSDSLRIAPT